MKIETTPITTIASCEHDRYRMEIDDNHMRHIMDMMSDMYENPIRAVLREYSINALDSHRAAQVEAPIEIHLPSALSPVLKIKDQGLGLDLDGLINVYRKYGASTKRDSNDQVGGFGIGAKSAFAVADQYTVIGTKDGVQTTVLFTRNDAGDADMLVLGQKDVDKPNGVVINIPIVDNFPAYTREAEELFSYWDPTTYICHGAKIEYLYKNAIHVSDLVTLLNENPLHWVRNQIGICFRTGEVAYALTPSLHKNIILGNEWHTITKAHQVIINLPTGSVDLAPSREGLRESKRTIKVVQEAIDQGLEEIKSHLLAQLSKADDKVDAIRKYIQNYNLMQILGPDPLWNDEPLPVCPDKDITISGVRDYGDKSRYWNDVWRRNSSARFILINADESDLDQPPVSYKGVSAEQYTFSHGSLANACANGHKSREVIEKIDPGYDAKNWNTSYYLAFTHEAKDDLVIQALACASVDINQLKNSMRKVKTPAPVSAKTKDLNLPYKVMIASGQIVNRNVKEMVAAKGKIIYQHGNNKPTTSVYDRLPKGSQLVLIQSHRLSDSFLSRLDQVGGAATPVEDAVKNIVYKEARSLDEAALRYLMGRALPNEIRDTLGDLLVRNSIGTPAYEKALSKAFPACPRGKSKQLRSLAMLAKQYDIKIDYGRDENFFKDLFSEYPALNLAYLALKHCDQHSSDKNSIIITARNALRKQDQTTYPL